MDRSAGIYLINRRLDSLLGVFPTGAAVGVVAVVVNVAVGGALWH